MPPQQASCPPVAVCMRSICRSGLPILQIGILRLFSYGKRRSCIQPARRETAGADAAGARAPDGGWALHRPMVRPLVGANPDAGTVSHRPAGGSAVLRRLLAHRVRPAKCSLRGAGAVRHAGERNRLPHHDGVFPGDRILAGRLRLCLRADLREHVPGPASGPCLYNGSQPGIHWPHSAGSERCGSPLCVSRTGAAATYGRSVRGDDRHRWNRGLLQHLRLGELGGSPAPSGAGRRRPESRGAAASSRPASTGERGARGASQRAYCRSGRGKRRPTTEPGAAPHGGDQCAHRTVCA